MKHGLDKHINHPWVKVDLKLLDNTIWFECTNSNYNHSLPLKKNGGIGLRNLSRRLELIYPGRHELELINNEDIFKVKLTLQLF